MRGTSKLELRTETIMPLGAHELEGVHGGFTFTTLARSSNWCIRGTIAATRSSQHCARVAGETIAKTPDYARRGNNLVKDVLGVSFYRSL